MYRNLGKRLFDIFFAGTALVVLSPVMAIVYLAIPLEDGGPAIFRQRRIGRDGAVFTLLKFRSMPVQTKELPSSHAAKLSVTRVGKIIRRTNLDELPQLINIIRGDMSIVGPRPALLQQSDVIRLRAETGADQCLPGLTGLAQINSYNGMSPEEKVRWDSRYTRELSLWTDLKVIGRTFAYLRQPPPVY